MFRSVHQVQIDIASSLRALDTVPLSDLCNSLLLHCPSAAKALIPRTIRDCCNWKLKQQVFQQIQAAQDPLEVDLFASCLTNQLPRFYSWRPDPEAEATDAFMQDWTIYQGFANRPWCLIHHCLTKVRKQAGRIVLITPLWKTQSWFPIVPELLEDYP